MVGFTPGGLGGGDPQARPRKTRLACHPDSRVRDTKLAFIYRKSPPSTGDERGAKGQR